MNTLRPYKHPIIAIPVLPEWVDDVEAYMRFLVAQDKEMNLSWAKSRRMCVLAFAYYYGSNMPELRQQYIASHMRFKKFPPQYDFKLNDGRTIKIASGAVSDKWNIGPTLSSKITEKAFQKGEKHNSLYVMASYNVSMVYFVGWHTQESLRQSKEQSSYMLRESEVFPMNELQVLDEIDTVRWYK